MNMKKANFKKSEKPMSEADNSSKKKVLFIDDNYDYYVVVKSSIGDLFHMDYAPDGFSAIHMVKKEHYDLILCDIYMPYIDGIKLLAEFSRKHLNIPFIMISGNIEEKVSRDALHAGAYNLMEKPIKIDELLIKIEKAIELHKSEKISSIEDQEKAHIYNTLKMYYYDVEKIWLSIQHFQIPFSCVQEELDKKNRTGKCIFDDLQNLKYFNTYKISS